MAPLTGMQRLSVVKQVAITNLIQNPSGENDTATWLTTGIAPVNNGASIARSSAARAGAWAFNISTDGVAQNEGLGCLIPTALTAQAYTLSAWMRPLSGSQNWHMLAYDIARAQSIVDTAMVIPALTYQRVSVTFTPAGSIPVNGLRIIFYSTGSPVNTLWLDAVQLEAGSVMTTYCDGDQPGCYWLGAPHGSQSSRPATTTEGGQSVVIAPNPTPAVAWPYMDTLEGMAGIGMEPVINISLARGLVGGATYQRSVRQARMFTVTGTFSGSPSIGMDDLHTKVQNVIDLLKPDIVPQPQTTILQYDNGGKTLNIRARYQSGLGGGGLNGFRLKAAIQFMAFEPMWYEDYDSSAALLSNQNLAVDDLVMRDMNGLWQIVGGGTGADNTVLALAQDASGNIYAGGAFTHIGGIAANRIAKWDGTSWTALGTGANDIVRAIVVGPDGTVYAGGDFTSMAGVSNTAGIAAWNGSAWSALGTGAQGVSANHGVYGLAVTNGGGLYATGDFSTAGGVANTLRIALWNGSAWTALSTGFNGLGRCLAYDRTKGVLYAGGGFTTAGGVAANSIALWNGTAWTALGTGGTSGDVFALAFSATGDLYAGGGFTAMGGVSNTGCVARWNGQGWYALANGFGSIPFVYSLMFLPNGQLWIGGTFDNVNNGQLLTPGRMCIWNGTGYSLPDIRFVSNPSIFCFLWQAGKNNLYVGYNVTGSTHLAAGTGLVINAGSAQVAPRIRLTGPGNVYTLTNYTTGDVINFTLSLLTGEVATLDLSAGNITFVSSFRGNILNTIQPGSKTATFRLLPGNNNLSFFADATVVGSLIYRNQYHSADSIL